MVLVFVFGVVEVGWRFVVGVWLDFDCWGCCGLVLIVVFWGFGLTCFFGAFL